MCLVFCARFLSHGGYFCLGYFYKGKIFRFIFLFTNCLRNFFIFIKYFFNVFLIFSIISYFLKGEESLPSGIKLSFRFYCFNLFSCNQNTSSNTAIFQQIWTVKVMGPGPEWGTEIRRSKRTWTANRWKRTKKWIFSESVSCLIYELVECNERCFIYFKSFVDSFNICKLLLDGLEVVVFLLPSVMLYWSMK